VIYHQTYLNDFSTTRALRAPRCRAGPCGVPTCRSVIDGTDPNCIPYNMWHLGGVNQAALDYVQIPLVSNGYTQQSVQGATLSSDLGNYGWKLPSSKNGIGVAFGLERRVEKLKLYTDAAFASGDGFGQGGPTIGLEGQYTVKEYFGEIRVPILEGQQFADLLSVNRELPVLGLLHRAEHGFLRYRRRVGARPVGQAARQLPAGRARRQRDRALPGAGHQPVRQRRAIRAVRRAPPTLAQCQRTGLTAAQYGRDPR
jgi:hypothetical protein